MKAIAEERQRQVNQKRVKVIIAAADGERAEKRELSISMSYVTAAKTVMTYVTYTYEKSYQESDDNEGNINCVHPLPDRWHSVATRDLWNLNNNTYFLILCFCISLRRVNSVDSSADLLQPCLWAN